MSSASRDPSRNQPIPASWSVEAGRDAYLRENGFTVGAYDEPRTRASLFGLDFTVPNTPRHRKAIMRHDLHHVATGFGTDVAGEGEVSAWELRRGLRGLDLYVSALVTGLALLGLVVAPRRTLRAWRLSGRGRSLFDDPTPYEQLLTMSVGELRGTLDIPIDGLAIRPRRLHARAPRDRGSP